MSTRRSDKRRWRDETQVRNPEAMERLSTLRYRRRAYISSRDDGMVLFSGTDPRGPVPALDFMPRGVNLQHTESLFSEHGPVPLPEKPGYHTTVDDMCEALTTAVFLLHIRAQQENDRGENNTSLELDTNVLEMTVVSRADRLELEYICLPPSLWGHSLGGRIVGALMHAAKMTGRAFYVSSAFHVTQYMCVRAAGRNGMRLVGDQWLEESAIRDLTFELDDSVGPPIRLCPVPRFASREHAQLAAAQCVICMAEVRGLYGFIRVISRGAVPPDTSAEGDDVFAIVWATKKQGNELVVVHAKDHIIATVPAQPP